MNMNPVNADGQGTGTLPINMNKVLEPCQYGTAGTSLPAIFQFVLHSMEVHWLFDDSEILRKLIPVNWF